MLQVPPVVNIASASPANSAAHLRMDGIRQIIGMPSRAVRFIVLPCSRPSALDILKVGDRFKMVWAHASAVAAEVIPLKPFRGFPSREEVGVHAPSFLARKDSVPTPCLSAHPQPALASFLDLGPEALIQRSSKLVNQDSSRVTIQSPPAVVHYAPRSRSCRFAAIRDGAKSTHMQHSTTYNIRLHVVVEI